MTPASDPKQGNRKSTEIIFRTCIVLLRLCVFVIFWVENGVSEGQEVLKKLPGSGALRCDRISCRGEPRGPDS